MASVDASQCYDRVAHAMAALTLRASKVPKSSVNCMLQPLRDMEFYIRTAYGESDTYAGGKENPKQGECQGNGAAPAGWQQISTVMLRAHRREGHGVTVTSPISKKSCKKAGLLYVDDTNLWAGMSAEDSLDDVVYKAQESIQCWGELLMATGGALNPEKCHWTVHDMVPRGDGSWEYRRCRPAASTIEEGKVVPGTDMMEDFDEGFEVADEVENHQLKVPQLTGDAAVIAQLQSCQAKKNLGLYAPPEGSSEPQFAAMRDRVDEWTNNIKNSDLPPRSVWLSYKGQLWPGLKYGLGALPAKLEDLDSKKKNGKEYGLGTRDHKILSRLGICRNINREWRYLPPSFGGMGVSII